MGCGWSTRKGAVLPPPPPPADEAVEFDRLVREPVAAGNSKWAVKVPMSAKYNAHGFRMRVALRRHTESGNPNLLLRADGHFRGGLTPEDFLQYLVNPANLPGLQEQRKVEDLPGGGFILYLRVKAPGLAPRDHCWRYTVDRRMDGSIFVCIRTQTHPSCPPLPGVIRAFYYNATLLRQGKDEAGETITELTEFILQDLGGGIPVCLMNAALPAGTIAFNKQEVDYLKKQRSGQAP